MDHLIACMFCGGIDPNADSLLLQAAIAGGITMPWMLRSKLLAMIDRVRGPRRSEDELACSLEERATCQSLGFPPPNPALHPMTAFADGP